jgi:hypothetical protein
MIVDSALDNTVFGAKNSTSGNECESVGTT